MKRRFFAATLALAAFCVAAAGPWLLVSPAAEPAAASDGVKAGQRIEVQYQVGAKTVYASATLAPDGTLAFAFPTEDGLRVGWATYRLVRQDSGPNPPPPPPPVPPVPPVTKATRIVVVYESKNAPTAVAVVAQAKVWRDEAKALGMSASLADPDQLAKPYPKMLAAANKIGLPAVVFMDDAGLVVAVEKLPATVPDMLALTKRIGGKP